MPFVKKQCLSRYLHEHPPKVKSMNPQDRVSVGNANVMCHSQSIQRCQHCLHCNYPPPTWPCGAPRMAWKVPSSHSTCTTSGHSTDICESVSLDIIPSLVSVAIYSGSLGLAKKMQTLVGPCLQQQLASTQPTKVSKSAAQAPRLPKMQLG